MAYDDYSPQTVAPGALELSDPHSVLDGIAHLDEEIARLKAKRSEMLSQYERVMKGIHDHCDAVLGDINKKAEWSGPEEEPSISKAMRYVDGGY